MVDVNGGDDGRLLVGDFDTEAAAAAAAAAMDVPPGFFRLIPLVGVALTRLLAGLGPRRNDISSAGLRVPDGIELDFLGLVNGGD